MDNERSLGDNKTVVFCKQCGGKFSISDAKIPFEGKLVKCPRCSSPLHIIKSNEYYKSNYSDSIWRYVCFKRRAGNTFNLNYDITSIVNFEKYLIRKGKTLVQASSSDISNFMEFAKKQLSEEKANGLKISLSEYFSIMFQLEKIPLNPMVAFQEKQSHSIPRGGDDNIYSHQHAKDEATQNKIQKLINFQELFYESTSKIVILSVISFGVYIYVWLVERRRPLNEIYGEEIYDIKWLYGGVVLSGLSTMTSLLSLSLGHQVKDPFSVGFGICIIVISFKISDCLSKILTDAGNTCFKINKIYLFLFTVFYLNYKLNELYNNNVTAPHNFSQVSAHSVKENIIESNRERGTDHILNKYYENISNKIHWFCTKQKNRSIIKLRMKNKSGLVREINPGFSLYAFIFQGFYLMSKGMFWKGIVYNLAAWLLQICMVIGSCSAAVANSNIYNLSKNLDDADAYYNILIIIIFGISGLVFGFKSWKWIARESMEKGYMPVGDDWKRVAQELNIEL